MKIIDMQNNINLTEIMNNDVKKDSSNVELEVPKVDKFDDIINDINTDIKPYIEPKIILSPEEAIQKRKLILHIKNYILSFPECLEEFKLMNLNAKSMDELNCILEECKLMVCNFNSGGIFLKGFEASCEVIETLGSIIKFDLTGLKYIASHEPNIQKCVKEITLEYMNLNYISPEKRLGMLMFGLCYQVNQMNKTNNNINNLVNSDISEKLEMKYNEL
jgi:hypothetical protein